MNPKTIAAIKREIKKTKADDRYQPKIHWHWYQVDAPPLMPMVLKARVEALEWVLDLEGVE